jgi:hypothetical protein
MLFANIKKGNNMKINRIAEEKNTPEWIFNNKDAANHIENKTLQAKDVKDILKMPSELSDEEVTIEKEKIEKCASANKSYYYNINWNQKVKSELKEYAQVCGVNSSNFKAIDPKTVEPLAITASDSKMIRTASKTEQKLVLNDPFKLDEKISNVHEKEAWTPKIELASKLSDKPNMSGIVALRGGENYFENSESKIARGQNSITDPNAIDKLANSSTEDTGARLRRENKEKENLKKVRHETWQKEKAEAMNKKDAVASRKVFPTESLNAQPGIKGEVFDYSKLPEKTAGELLKEQNEDRRKQIRGESKPKHEFNIAKNPTRSISDDFSSELKKFLK